MSNDRYDLNAAIVRHYATQQEGLPPPVPSREHLRIPFEDWLAEKYPRPWRPVKRFSRAAEYQAYLDERYPPKPAPPEGQLVLPLD